MIFLVGNKGQAFSVFELMIAGIVAFAILIILLMIINNTTITPYSDAKTVISNAIKTASPSGESTTTDFVLKKDDSIDNGDLSVKTDTDQKSIFFVYGQFSTSDGIQVDSPSPNSFVKYTGATQKKLAARVICKQTAQQLDDALSRLSSGSSNYDTSPGGGSFCEDVTPCCAIVLIRPSK